MRKVKASHNSEQVQHLYQSYFLLLIKPALSEVQMYVFDSLLKHQFTRENTFALIRSCGNEVYKVEKSKEDTWELGKLRSRNFSMTSEEFLWTKIIYVTMAKCSFTVSITEIRWYITEKIRTADFSMLSLCDLDH